MVLISLKKKSLLLATGGILGICMLAASCSSSPDYIKTEVINNSDRTLTTPDWVLSSQILSEENGDVVYIYKMNLDGSVRPDACVAMARTQAGGQMMQYIKNAITTSGQVEDLNASEDPSYNALTAFLSQGSISGAKTTQTYWEQTIEGDETGLHPVKKLLCAVKVSISKTTLDKQMRDAINGQPGGNPEIRQKLLNAQKDFIDSVGQSDAAKAQPAGGDTAPTNAPAP
jgi:hypothetical protein